MTLLRSKPLAQKSEKAKAGESDPLQVARLIVAELERLGVSP